MKRIKVYVCLFPANFGTDITKHPWVKDSILFIFTGLMAVLSLKSLEKLLQTKKLLFGLCMICGYLAVVAIMLGRAEILNWSVETVISLKTQKQRLSWKVWNRSQFHAPEKMNVVTCSRWLGKEAKASSLLQMQNKFHSQSHFSEYV